MRRRINGNSRRDRVMRNRRHTKTRTEIGHKIHIEHFMTFSFMLFPELTDGAAFVERRLLEPWLSRIFCDNVA
jgi:hypothetical protein